MGQGIDRARVCLQTLFTKSCYDREMCYYDIPEDLWLRLEPILPTEGSPRGGRPIGDVRNFLNAVHWMLRTGSPWRALPEKYGSWKTVYSRFRRWQKRGYLTAILKLLTLQADMNHIMIDGTYVHAHKHSAGARHTSGINQALGRSRGGFTSKIHAVVDALGNLLAFTVTAGQYSEYPQASNLLIQYHNTTILADKGYDSRSLIDALHQQGCKAVIPSRRTNHHPRTIDRHLYKERHLRACLETSALIVTRRHVDKKRLCAAAKTREDCQTVPQRSDGQRMGACTSSPAPCFWRRSEAQNRPA